MLEYILKGSLRLQHGDPSNFAVGSELDARLGRWVGEGY